jgi:hypothetical protein
VNATGTVHFWAGRPRRPGQFLVKQFNATHKNLKVVLHLTRRTTTSQLATPSGPGRCRTWSG